MVTRFLAIALSGLALAGCAHVQAARLCAVPAKSWTMPMSSGALAIAQQRCSLTGQVERLEAIDARAHTMTMTCVAPSA